MRTTTHLAFIFTLGLAVSGCSGGSTSQDYLPTLTSIDAPQIIGGNEVLASDELVHEVCGITLDVITNGDLYNAVSVERGSAAVASDRFLVTAAHLFNGAKTTTEYLPNGDVVEHKIGVRFGTLLNGGNNLFYLPFNVLSNQQVLDKDFNGPDYVFIELPKNLSWPIRSMPLSHEPEKYAPGALVRVAGYGIHRIPKDHLYPLITDEFKVTGNQSNSSRLDIPRNRLNTPWFMKYFLQYQDSLNSRMCNGDSGGPVYYVGEWHGAPQNILAGIHISKVATHNSTYDRENCIGPNFALSVDAFLADAIAFYKKLNGGG